MSNTNASEASEYYMIFDLYNSLEAHIWSSEARREAEKRRVHSSSGWWLNLNSPVCYLAGSSHHGHSHFTLLS